MGRSWPLGRLFGIRVYMHWSFLLLVAWVVLATLSQGYLAAVTQVLFLLALFACVVMHEFGHALTARRFGIGTRDITLLPIGGVARLERMPEAPSQELAVAVAGPMVNVVIAVVLGVILHLSGGIGAAFEAVEPGNIPFLTGLFVVNIILVLFNVLPAFPMDGGRVLRALLHFFMPYVRATRVAAVVGQMFAAAFAMLAVLGYASPVLLLIAVFVFFAAGAEARQVATRAALHDVPVEDAMVRDFRALTPQDSVQSVMKDFMRGWQSAFPVVRPHEQPEPAIGEARKDDVVGFVTRRGLVQRLTSGEGVPTGQAELRIRDVMDPHVEALSPHDHLDDAWSRMQQDAPRFMPVLDHGRLVGILTLENLSEFMMMNRVAPPGGGAAPPAGPHGESADAKTRRTE